MLELALAMVPSSATSAAEALTACGGPTATNPLAAALGEIAGAADPAVVADQKEAAALAAVGGSAAVNPVARAVKALKKPDPKYRQPGVANNLTCRWMAANWARVRPMLLTYLASKPAMGSRMGELEDFLGTWVTNLMEQDYLAPYLGAGLPVRDSVLKVWLYQKAVTNVRGMGVDALTRHMHAARTESERRYEREHGEKLVVGSAEAKRQVLASGDKVDRKNSEAADLMDPDNTPLDVQIDRKRLIDRCRAAIQDADPARVEFYNRVFDSMILGNPDLVEDVPARQLVAATSRIRSILGEELGVDGF